MLQEEKRVSKNEYRESEAIQMEQKDHLLNEIGNLKELIDEKIKQLNDLNTDLKVYKEAADIKTGEITKIKREIFRNSEENTNCIQVKREFEKEIVLETKKKDAIQLDIDQLYQRNEMIEKDEAELCKKIKENEHEIIKLKRAANELDAKFIEEESLRKKRDNDFVVIIEEKKQGDMAIDDFVCSTKLMEKEKEGIIEKANDLECQINYINCKINDNCSLLSKKDNEIKNARKELNFIEEQNLDLGQAVLEAQKENHSLVELLENYKKEANTHKKLRDSEISKKNILEKEKIWLENKVIEKKQEARETKYNLSKVNENHEKLLNHHYNLNKELDALKDHTELLASQNNNVR